MQKRSLQPRNTFRILLSIVLRRRSNEHVPARLKSGLFVAANLRTPLGLELFRYREHREDIGVLHAELRGGDVFIDCGANIGLFTIEAARLVGDAGRVVSFEPVVETRETLVRTVGLNGQGNVIVLPYALADQRAAKAFTAIAGGGQSSFAPDLKDGGYKTTVDVEVLDSLIPQNLLSRVRLIKIDVEGAEHLLLLGAKNLLLTSRPTILIELSDDNLRRQYSSVSKVHELLESLQYRRSSRFDSQAPNFVYEFNNELLERD